jgi:hypothetical protein
MKNIFVTTVGFHALTTRAHDGHGWVGGHWHASDAFGFVALAVAVAVALWCRHDSRRNVHR